MMDFGALSDRSDLGKGHQQGADVTIPSWKRALDLALILLSAPITILVGAVIVCVVKVSSRGPVLFRQERIGYRGRRFICLKFRSMHVAADTTTHRDHLHELMQSDSPMTKLDLKGDPRLIPFGRLLRASGLDELPQLLNILRGEMSLVGPRPCLAYEYEKYSDWQLQRFETVPGLTGWWQVRGKNRTTFNEMIRMDIWYAQHKSLWLDLGIIFRTIPALAGQLLESRLANCGEPSPQVAKVVV
jgi:lipopolysaccharide/colanic/teichoic acid biosynthesis glycosyltransferase